VESQVRAQGHPGLPILQHTQPQVRPNSVNPNLQFANLDPRITSSSVVGPEWPRIKIQVDNHDPSLSQRSNVTEIQRLQGQDPSMVAQSPLSPTLTDIGGETQGSIIHPVVRVMGR
jgi:hypothetical protein